MVSSKQVQLIERIYQVILNPDDWESMTDALNHEIGSYGINMWMGDRVLLELQHFWASANIRSSMDAYLKSGFVEAERPLIATLPEITSNPGLMHIKDFQAAHNHISEDKLDLEPLSQWLKDNYGVEERYISSLNQHSSYYDCINVSFGELSQTELTNRVGISNFFLPHLANLVAISRPFLLLKARFNAVLDVLDRFRLGVFLLAPYGDVISYNHAAELILHDIDGIRTDNKNRLKLSSQQDNQRLQQAIAQVISADGQNRKLKLTVERRSMRTAYLLEVSPIYHQDIPVGVLVIVIDPDDRSIIDTSSFTELFGLTSAEQSICQLLAEGNKAQDISDIRHTSLETVRGQIKSVQAKTKAREKSELVRLALSINLPVDTA